MRNVVLERDRFAHAFSNGMWIFAGQDAGRSIRLRVRDHDWRAIQAQASDLGAAFQQLERLAATATDAIDDGYGGYFVPIVLDSRLQR